jgi:hypothetical protein
VIAAGSYMAELSRHVPIIPVIMKADTMTIHEAQRFRQEVVNRLLNPGQLGSLGWIERADIRNNQQKLNSQQCCAV